MGLRFFFFFFDRSLNFLDGCRFFRLFVDLLEAAGAHVIEVGVTVHLHALGAQLSLDGS